MAVETIPDCPLAFTTADLSRWHDGERDARTRQFGEHLAECAACRARLAEYQRIAASLQAAREPDLNVARFWADVRRRAGASRHAPLAFPAPSKRAWTTAGSLAAVLLLAVGFAALFRANTRPVNPAGTPTATATTGTLAWQQQELSIAGYNGPIYSDMGVAQSDGKTAYACLVPSYNENLAAPLPPTPAHEQVQVWATHDHGATWTHSSIVTPSNVNGCSVTVDSIQSSTVAIMAYHSTMNGSDLAYTYVSFDGAAHWQTLATPPAKPKTLSRLGTAWVAPSGLATYQNRTYALFNVQEDYGIHSTMLAVSDDHMAHWQSLDEFLPAEIRDANGTANVLLVNPTSGDVLIEAYAYIPGDPAIKGSGTTIDEILSSNDGGRSWATIPLPADNNRTGLSYWVSGTGAAQWYICEERESAPEQCTFDNGQTWAVIPTPPSRSTFLMGIVPMSGGLMYIEGEQAGTIYLLRPGSQTWQVLGTAPSVDDANGVIVVATDGWGLWDYFIGQFNDGKMPIYTASLPA